MKKILLIAILTFTIIFLHTILQNQNFKVFALTQQALEQNVQIDIKEDSSFTVTEKVKYVFNGNFHGLRRNLTIEDNQNLVICRAQGLTCGGFNRVEVTNVRRINGTQIPLDELNFYEVEENGNKYYRVEWELYPDGKDVSNFEIDWEIEYKVYGGIQKVGSNPYFYWDLLPEDRGSITKKSNIKIIFPPNILFKKELVEIYTGLPYKINYLQSQDRDVVELNLLNLTDLQPITLSYKFNKGEIKLPGILEYDITYPPLGASIYMDDKLIGQDLTNGSIPGVTSGKHTLKVSRFGYEDINIDFNITEDQTLTYTFELKSTPLFKFLEIINTLALIAGVCFIPGGILLSYLYYLRNGRDKKFPKTIIPEFEPPKDVRPYILGTLKDEKVDKEDMAATIIDLAYRGYLKIKKLKKNEYELTDTKKDQSDLDSIEKEIFSAIFNGGETTTTKEMVKTFPYKYSSIVSSINTELVSRKFFNESPQTTKGKYLGCGIFLLVGGTISIFFISALLTQLFGYFTVFTVSIALAILGLSFTILANFMPAKTELGSQAFAKILGFKMYLQTAERFTLQKLEPEYFEKYLSYAIVFGIEKEWAQKFEGLYDKQPDWYEGDSTDGIFNAYVISSFARSFSTSTVSAFSFPAQSSSGSGWSSGGSFGGFSGGGGGGGSSGGW